MKKLALIVLLAVVASRVLADRGKHHHPNAPHSTTNLTTWFDDDPPAPPPVLPAPRPAEEPAPGIRTVPWRGGETPTANRTPDARGGDSKFLIKPAPEFAPAVPAPPGRASRSKRRATVTPNPPAPSKVAPPWFPKSDWEEEGLARPDAAGVRILLGRLSASEERARLDLRKTVNHEISDWLAADVAMTWTPPQKLVDRMVLGTYVQTVNQSFAPKPGEITPEVPGSSGEIVPELNEVYTLYRAGQKLDFSATRRAGFVEAYQRDVASLRMRKFGSVIAVVLALLAVTSFYVRADEATKGYYTNRLRALATLGLGAAGAVAYHYWA